MSGVWRGEPGRHELLASLAGSRPLLFVLEDLHWLDPASAEILEGLLIGVPGRAILVLAAQRPDWTAPWSEWPWTELIELRPLPGEEAAILAGAVLGGARLSGELEAHLRERAEGNPFFVEELVRYLQETGSVEEREGEVRLLPGVAERLPGRVTAQMGNAHLWRGTPGEGVALVQPMIEQLAGSGPSRALASLYLALASILWRVGGARREQQEAAERAVEIARTIGDERLLAEAEVRRGMLLDDLEEQLRVFEAAIQLVESGGDLDFIVNVLDCAGATCWEVGRMEECCRYHERALEVGERVGNPDRLGALLGNLANALLNRGDWEGAEKHLERAARLLGGKRTTWALWVLVPFLELALHQGRWEDAERLGAETLALRLLLPGSGGTGFFQSTGSNQHHISE